MTLGSYQSLHNQLCNQSWFLTSVDTFPPLRQNYISFLKYQNIWFVPINLFWRCVTIVANFRLQLPSYAWTVGVAKKLTRDGSIYICHTHPHFFQGETAHCFYTSPMSIGQYTHEKLCCSLIHMIDHFRIYGAKMGRRGVTRPSHGRGGAPP